MSEIPTFDQLVNSELSKYDSVIPKVEELKAEYMSLTIQSIEDKDGYQRVKDGIRFMVMKRNEIEEKRKQLKADSLAFGRAVDSRAREITSLITPIEEYLKDQKAKIDEQLEQIKMQEELKRQAKIKERHNALLQSGMSLVGNEYIWNDRNDATNMLSFATVNLETLSDEEFQIYVEEATIQIQREKTIFDSISKERERLLEEQRKLKEEQEMMRKEIEQMRSVRTLHRVTQLTNLGLVASSIFGIDQMCYPRNMTFIPVISVHDVQEYNTEDWEQILHQLTDLVKRFRSEDEKIKAEETRRMAEQAEALKKEQEAKAEQERLAGLSDKEKVADYCKRLLEVPTPEVKTLKWKKELKVITTTIVEHLD